MKLFTFALIASSLTLFPSCGNHKIKTDSQTEKIRIIIDSDTNNELDDQHAIAYALFNGDIFDVEGIAVNKTENGGDVEKQKAEAVRVVKLCGLYPQIKVYKGANGRYEDIVQHIDEPDFDGAEAVNFIINRAKAKDNRKLVIVPVGKLTNIALAIKKDPGIIPHIKVLWLGTNYPDDSPEYNFFNDISALNPVLESDVEFETGIVGGPDGTGTASVRASTEEIRRLMPDKGPHISNPDVGRHGGKFTNFGDYSVSLFENTQDSQRSLYDVAAYAIIKNPEWAVPVEIGAPKFIDKHWLNNPDNSRKIIIWDHFDQKEIMDDFYNTMKHYKLVTTHIK
jgi:inosine-uridine nucleoside N-ribohydrolase